MTQEHRVRTYLYISHCVEDIVGPVRGELADTYSRQSAHRVCDEVKAYYKGQCSKWLDDVACSLKHVEQNAATPKLQGPAQAKRAHNPLSRCASLPQLGGSPAHDTATVSSSSSVSC